MKIKATRRELKEFLISSLLRKKTKLLNFPKVEK